YARHHLLGGCLEVNGLVAQARGGLGDAARCRLGGGIQALAAVAETLGRLLHGADAALRAGGQLLAALPELLARGLQPDGCLLRVREALGRLLPQAFAPLLDAGARLPRDLRHVVGLPQQPLVHFLEALKRLGGSVLESDRLARRPGRELLGLPARLLAEAG